jgi:hypothetical protein
MDAPTKYDEKSKEPLAEKSEPAKAGPGAIRNDKLVRASGPPSSTFWHFDDLNPIRGTFRFNANIGTDKVNSASQIAVSITETRSGTPVFGDAPMSVLNVVPLDDGTVWVRANVNFDLALPVRLNFIIFN